VNAYARDVGDVFEWTGSQVFTLTSSLCSGALANPAYRLIRQILLFFSDLQGPDELL
jgi:hypothetical protein